MDIVYPPTYVATKGIEPLSSPFSGARSAS